MDVSTAAQERPRTAGTLDVALCTFAVLALELGLIRWFGGQIRLVAYFSNLILLAAFLGMGLGIALGRRRPSLVHAALPAVALLAAVLAYSEPLGLMRVRFPDPSIFLWDAQAAPTSLWHFASVSLFVVALFWAVAGIFALVSSPLGALFDRLPALRAYSADIAGSLAGIVAVTLVSAAGAKPWQWIALGVVPVVWFSRTPLSIASAAAAIGLAAHSGSGAWFSPYNRIDLVARAAQVENVDPLRREWELNVNRDYHQRISDLSNRRVTADSLRNPALRPGVPQAVYELPFRLRPGGTSGLIVGAGTGNDAAGALRAGFARVTAVEIDPTILQLGRVLHPEDPYGDGRVRIVNDDARAYFARSGGERFDVVSYGLVDSHAMFSAMSSLRLDNYVYTREGVAAGWRHVRDDGVLAISFSVFAGPWIEHRLHRTIREATGQTPLLVRHNLDYGVTFLVGRSLDAALVPVLLQGTVASAADPGDVRVPTDDWPFLYMRPGAIPFGYLTVLLLIALTATLAIRRVYAGRADAAGPGFDWPMFLMGAGFMLLETRMVTALSLLFGSTWIVNACVFGGVLVMVLIANLFVARRGTGRTGLWFGLLLAGVAATVVVSADVFNSVGIVTRGVLAGVLYSLPIGFAGVIVATLLARSAVPGRALGANLLGAVLGGILEYSSMFLGLRFVAILAFVCYAAAYAVLRARAVEGRALPETALGALP